MKNMFKKVFSSLVAIASLSTCTVSNFANATTTSPSVDTFINVEESAMPRYSINFTVKNNALNYVNGASINGSADRKIYAGCNSGNVTVYVMYGAEVKYSRTFYPSSPTPALDIHVPPGSSYDIYVKCSSASSSNPVSGYVSIYT